VTVRIIWGFVGSKHSRFIDFLYGPAAVVSYLLDLLRSRSKRYIGHSPAGGAMVIALLLCLVGTVVTGVALYGAQEKAGPLRVLYAATSSMLPERGLVVTAAADENSRERRDASNEKEGVLKEYHEVLANITLGLVIIHIMAVFWASMVHRENLAWSMVTGRKRAE
jgi:cytochrome b